MLPAHRAASRAPIVRPDRLPTGGVAGSTGPEADRAVEGTTEPRLVSLAELEQAGIHRSLSYISTLRRHRRRPPRRKPGSRPPQSWTDARWASPRPHPPAGSRAEEWLGLPASPALADLVATPSRPVLRLRAGRAPSPRSPRNWARPSRGAAKPSRQPRRSAGAARQPRLPWWLTRAAPPPCRCSLPCEEGGRRHPGLPSPADLPRAPHRRLALRGRRRGASRPVRATPTRPGTTRHDAGRRCWACAPSSSPTTSAASTTRRPRSPATTW